MQVEGPAATFLRMQVDLPGLAQGVRLDEVAFVMNVKAVVDRVVLQVGHISGDVDDGHSAESLMGGSYAPPCRRRAQ
jgi:hypothetical protein